MPWVNYARAERRNELMSKKGQQHQARSLSIANPAGQIEGLRMQFRILATLDHGLPVIEAAVVGARSFFKPDSALC
jgi:hypothetical protein